MWPAMLVFNPPSLPASLPLPAIIFYLRQNDWFGKASSTETQPISAHIFHPKCMLLGERFQKPASSRYLPKPCAWVQLQLPLKTNVNDINQAMVSVSPGKIVHFLCAPLAAIVIKPDASCFNLYMIYIYMFERGFYT